MEERVGQVVLNLDKYPGQDFYCEGPVEDRLLEIAKTAKEEEYNEIIARSNSWTILYHFSHIRQNVVSWLPITKEDTVLEIGAGCGAITGALAQMAKKVTCIELSKKRSLINANRNKDKKNINILVGNFSDIEKDLKEKYDYITLIGVFEYAASYISGDNPYENFLNIIKTHLKPNGKLVIAIENQLGLKYFAGCVEDHTGRMFEGIEGYPNANGVKTFSRSALEQLFKKCRLDKYSFYYPYPDYKFPFSIYSDEYLPKPKELTDNINNFNDIRYVLFDERQVFDTMIKNDMFPQFANSFLVILEQGEDE